MSIRPGPFVVGLLLAVGPAFAAPGDLDPTFGTGGRVTTNFGAYDGLADVLLQPDGKIVAIGSTEAGVSRIAVARYDASGALDPTFGTGGMVTTKVPGVLDDFGGAGLLLDDGKLLVAGRGGGDFALLRYDVAGVLDPTFGSGGISTITPYPINGAAMALLRQPNGKLVAAGYVHNGTDFDFGVRRYEADGSLDLTFGDGGLASTTFGAQNDVGIAAALQPDGKIVEVGHTFVSDSDVDIALVRFEPDGTLDGSFGLGGKVITALGPDDQAGAVALQPDGKIVVAGATNIEDLLVARYDTDGSLDATFGTGGVVTVSLTTSVEVLRDVRVLPDGKLLVVGYRLNTAFPVFLELVLLRLDADGTLDTGFGVGGVVTTTFATPDAVGVGIALQTDGKIVVGASVGDILDSGSSDDFALARYEGTPPACGNGVIEPGESCDDGGAIGGDGCDATCQIESGFACASAPSVCTAGCGDGAIAGSEGCDDGNLTAGDGCNAVCQLEPGWTCAGAPTSCSAVCGDSRIVGSEQCDDGNAVGGDCCDATCQFEAPGSPCLDERSLCYTMDTCGAGGVCTHVTAADPLCVQPIEAKKARLKIVRPASGKNQLSFKWSHGPVVPLASFGDPVTGNPLYTLCVYDESGGTTTGIVQARALATPFSCDNHYGCWIASPVGWKYKASLGAPDGVVSLGLRSGLLPGKSKVQAKLKGSSFVAPGLPLAVGPRVVAELRTSDGQCFGAAFSLPNRNDALQFSAKSD